MKNKLKALVAGTLGVCAMAMVGVAKVNAASLTYGSVLVSTTSYAGDTKTWDFTTNLPSSNTTIAVGSDINGIVTSYGGDSSKTIQIKNSAKNAYDTYPGAEFLVPVPSATSTGTVTRTGNADSTRFLALGSNTAKELAASMTFDFTTTDIETNPTLSDSTTVTGYYLRFTASGGEAKTYSFSVQLKDGTSSYGSATVTHTITYKDGDSILYTDAAAVEGSNITYSPKKYGYDFEGWYTEAELTNKVDSSYTVTADDTLYAKWTAWTTTGIEEYTLSNAAIGKIATGIDGSLTADLALTPSIYTYMKGGTMTTTNVTLPNEKDATQSPCFNTNAAVSTTGNGIKFTAPFNGTLTTYIGVGGGSSRNAKLTDGTNDVIPTQGAAALAFDYDTVGYAPIELTFEVTKGTTYYLGGDNGMRIYYLNLEADPSATFLAQYDTVTAADATKIRLIAVLDNISDVTTVDTVKFTFTYDGGERTLACTKLYSAVTSLGTTDDYAAKTNRYFAVFTLTDIESAIVAEKSLTNLKVTVTFTDGSDSVIAEHADIALGK